LPNKGGLVFGLVLVAIFMTSINYGINLGYALNFLLVSCGWLAILLTYRNITGLGLEALPSPAVYSGELAHFVIHLNNHSKRVRYALYLGFDRSALQAVDIPKQSSHTLTLSVPTQNRGWLPCPRVRLQTTFPFGLLTAWCYWRIDQRILVFPKPELNPPPLPFTSYVGDGAQGARLPNDFEELSGVREYQQGDSPKHLAWRQIARHGGSEGEHLITKQFEGQRRERCLLDFASLPAHLTMEQKLSRLCAWSLLAEEHNTSYAFQLGATHYIASSGEDHLRACLTALALYPNGDQP
jgi:uncharacterized protein (DUF58 family)